MTIREEKGGKKQQLRNQEYRSCTVSVHHVREQLAGSSILRVQNLVKEKYNFIGSYEQNVLISS